MATLAMTRVNSPAYQGYKKMIGGKIHYLGQDEREAEIRLLQILLEQRTGVRPLGAKGGGLSLHQTLDAFAEHIRQQPLSSAWRQTMAQRIGRVQSIVADSPMVEIQPAILTTWVSQIRAKFASPYSQRNIVQTLKMGLKWARGQNHCTLPPTIDEIFKARRRVHFAPEMQVMTLEQFGTLYRAAPPRMQAMILCAANFGATQNDLSTLAPVMIDWRGSRLTRCRQKTGVRANWPMWGTTAEALKRELKQCRGPLMWVTASGQPLVRHLAVNRTDCVTGAWLRLTQRVGIRIGFRSIRKMVAQMVREAGGLEACQMYLAHVGTSVAERHYTRPVQSVLDSALAKVEPLIEAALKK